MLGFQVRLKVGTTSLIAEKELKFTFNTFGLAKKSKCHSHTCTVTANQQLWLVKTVLHTIDKNFIVFAFARADKVNALFIPPSSSFQVQWSFPGGDTQKQHCQSTEIAKWCVLTFVSFYLRLNNHYESTFPDRNKSKRKKGKVQILFCKWEIICL